MNIYNHDIPDIGEDFYTLFKGDRVQIKKIVSSNKLEDKLYIQEDDEFVVLIEGEAILEVDKKIITLIKGDTLLIPAKIPHKVLHTKKGTIWLAIYIKNS